MPCYWAGLSPFSSLSASWGLCSLYIYLHVCVCMCVCMCVCVCVCVCVCLRVYTHTHTYSHTHTHAYTHTHTHTYTHTHTHTHRYCVFPLTVAAIVSMGVGWSGCSSSGCLAVRYCQRCAWTLSHTHTHSHAHSLSLSLSLSLSHTHTHTHAHSLSLSLSLTHTHTHTHPHTHRLLTTGVGLVWSTKASMGFLDEVVSPKRSALAAYPVVHPMTKVSFW
jgi:hypothetical protein